MWWLAQACLLLACTAAHDKSVQLSPVCISLCEPVCLSHHKSWMEFCHCFSLLMRLTRRPAEAVRQALQERRLLGDAGQGPRGGAPPLYLRSLPSYFLPFQETHALTALPVALAAVLPVLTAQPPVRICRPPLQAVSQPDLWLHSYAEPTQHVRSRRPNSMLLRCRGARRRRRARPSVRRLRCARRPPWRSSSGGARLVP